MGGFRSAVSACPLGCGSRFVQAAGPSGRRPLGGGVARRVVQRQLTLWRRSGWEPLPVWFAASLFGGGAVAALAGQLQGATRDRAANGQGTAWRGV